MGSKKFYVALTPDGARRMFDTWDECKAYRDSIRGTRVHSVDSREKAKRIIAGGIILEPGRFAFTDGNALGGVGIVLLASDGNDVYDVYEIPTNVFDVFASSQIPGLRSREEVAAALDAHHNILAELAALHGVLIRVPEEATLTVVHDYEGVGAWMLQGGWKTRRPITASVVAACKALVEGRKLDVSYQHQRGHQSTWAGRDDYARWNGRADESVT
jgi:hypothetical protein